MQERKCVFVKNFNVVNLVLLLYIVLCLNILVCLLGVVSLYFGCKHVETLCIYDMPFFFPASRVILPLDIAITVCMCVPVLLIIVVRPVTVGEHVVCCDSGYLGNKTTRLV